MIIEIISLSILVIVGGLLLYARWNYGTLEKLNIPVVKPHLFLGSNPDGHKVVTPERDLEWFKKYGPTFGVYDGRIPMVFVCDAEMIKHIFIKDYEHFHSRRFLSTGDKIMDQSMDFQHYDKWKALRGMISPIFTISRLKAMNQDMVGSMTDWLKDVEAEIDSVPGKRLRHFDLYDELFTTFCDLIARCVFSITIDRKERSENFLVQTLKKYMSPLKDREEAGFMSTLVNAFPFLRGSMPFFDPEASESFIRVFRNIVTDRKKSGTKKDDIIAQIITMLDRVDSEEYKQKDINELTVMAQAMVFFMAGQDQFAVIITYMAYCLSQDPEREKKVHDELDAFLARHNNEIKHDYFNELVYTTACITEALRLVPPFTRPERLCMKDWKYNDIFIPKGMIVVAPLYAVNRNPEYFEDPESFVPERFLPENKTKLHPCAFSSFGHGPKNCIAYRFNWEVLTVVAVTLFSKYRFIATEETKLELLKATHLVCNLKPLYFDVVKRN